MKIKVVCIILFFVAQISAARVNLIVYSFDRPLLLESFLGSYEKNVSGCDRVTVIYRASGNDIEQAYDTVRLSFPDIEFLKQSRNARADFKPLTLKAVDFNREPYVIFAVDDIVITRPIDFDECVEALEKENAFALLFRLGKNITECYMTRQQTPVPALISCANNFYKWKLKNKLGDWGYPHNLDMTLYRKSDIIKFFSSFDYTSPNLLEGHWAGAVPKQVWESYGLCTEYSCIVNCPINRVQTDCPGNRNTNLYSCQELLEIFNLGLKIDIEPLQDIMNKAPHMDYNPTFIAR
jgi:hypothetical protein